MQNITKILMQTKKAAMKTHTQLLKHLSNKVIALGMIKALEQVTSNTQVVKQQKQCYLLDLRRPELMRLGLVPRDN